MKIKKVGVLGATGAVGQNYLRLLENHPWFEVTYVAASPNSAGKRFSEAVKWFMDSEIPASVSNLVVYDVNKPGDAVGKCDLVFSAFELDDKEATKKLEEEYARLGFAVVSNNSAHRWTPDVPMIIPEINSSHLELISTQRKNRGFSTGFIVVKPNCSIQSFLAPVYALILEGYKPREMFVTTLQALSGAGYPGVASLAILDNVVPYISGEEEKTEKEPLRILGSVVDGKIVNNSSLKISAICTRVNVQDGHLACVQMKFDGAIPTLDEVLKIFSNFKTLSDLPFAPSPAIIYRSETDRPQPRKDRNNGNGMAVTVGKLKNIDGGISFVGLSHNTVRGAAGGAILIAELLYSKGYLG